MRKTINRIVSGLLVALGFSASSCDKDGKIPEEMVMYGPGPTEYRMMGKVSDATSKEGIQGIRMVFHGKPIDPEKTDTIYTKTGGYYTYNIEMAKYDFSKGLWVTLEDVDGTANGSFESRTENLYTETENSKTLKSPLNHTDFTLTSKK